MRCEFNEVRCTTNDKFVCFQCINCEKKIALLKTLKPEFQNIFNQLPNCAKESAVVLPAITDGATTTLQLTYSATAKNTGNTVSDTVTTQEHLASIAKSPPAIKFKENPAGAGTQLKRLLARVGIKASDTCSCTARATKMDEMGIEWCEQNINEITGWLKEEAARRNLPFLAYPTKVLITRAIKIAKKVRDAQQL